MFLLDINILVICWWKSTPKVSKIGTVSHDGLLYYCTKIWWKICVRVWAFGYSKWREFLADFNTIDKSLLKRGSSGTPFGPPASSIWMSNFLTPVTSIRTLKKKWIFNQICDRKFKIQEKFFHDINIPSFFSLSESEYF